MRFEALESRRLLATISGRLVYDLDANGAADLDEPGLVDWRVYVDQDNNNRYDEGEIFSSTDADGNYRLEGLETGFHVVAREPQSGWQQSYPPGTGKWTVPVVATQDVFGYDFAERRAFTPFEPGNLLLTRSSFGEEDFLLEYTPEGQLVQALVIPGSQGNSRLIAKDLVLDSRGRVQIFNGYDDVRLTTFDPASGVFSSLADPLWDLGRSSDAWGDIAAVGNFLFVNEHRDDRGVADGLIRFNVDDLSYQRFSGSFALPTDVAVGLDGLLYTLNAAFNNTTVQVQDPATMVLLRTFNVPEPLRSLAVDAAGNLYATTDVGLKHFDPAGQLVKSTQLAGGEDIVISREGLLAVSSNQRVDLIDTDFTSVRSFDVLGNAAINFTSFTAFVQEPVSDLPDSGEPTDYGVFTPGNILVSNSPQSDVPKLLEYTPFGQLVQEFEIPELESGGARDLVVDAAGDVYIYNGTFQPSLTRFDPHPAPTTGQPIGFSDGASFPGWNTADNPAFGGLATYGNFVFATDTRAARDSQGQRGIVRYDLEKGTFERRHADKEDIIDVNVGLDGLLYTLGPMGSSLGTTLRRYHPVTMQLLSTISLPLNHRAVAVDANGDIFAAGPEIYHYDRSGLPLGRPLDDRGIGALADIDLDADGRLLVASQTGWLLVTDRDFTTVHTFPTRNSDGRNFAAFVGPTRGALKANSDALVVDEDSQANLLEVTANDALDGPGALAVVAASAGSQGGTVVVASSTQVSYTPRANFVGVERFTYTIVDGQGGSDQALVEVSVQGTANFFAVDDLYQTQENLPVTVPAGAGLLVNDGGLDIFPVLGAGNILVAHSPVGTGSTALLQEYRRNGTLVRSVPLPDFSGGSFADVRDLVVDRAGNVQIYNGTFNPRLTAYDPLTASLSHRQFDHWNTGSNVTFGGLTAWRNFVFATDQQVGDDTSSSQAGIVRFDIDSGQATRFVDDGDFIDLNVGLDGLLYALGPAGPPSGQYLRVYQPETMQLVRQITLPAGLSDMRAITVDANGQIYAVRYRDPRVFHLSSTGAILRQYNTGMGTEADFSDIDLHENGRDLLIANINFSNTTDPNDGDLVLLTTAFAGRTILQAPDSSSDMKFAAWVQGPVGALNRPLTVSAHTSPTHGTLVLNPSGSLDPDGSFTYVPDPGYSGLDQFTYVVRAADGQQRSATVSLQVAPLNDRPVLIPASPADVSDEDLAYTLPLTGLINGGAGTTRVSDADPNDPLGGVAVVAASGQGTWSYSTNGTIFANMGVVSSNAALLLPWDAYIRFTPSGGAGGTASISYRAWDTTLGTPANKFDTTQEFCQIGDTLDPDTGQCVDPTVPEPVPYPPEVFVYESFSEGTDTLQLSMADLNDAPLLLPALPLIGVTDEHTPLAARLDAFVTGVSDPDTGGGLEGLAVVAASGSGFWEYSLDGSFYQPLPAVQEYAALLLDADDYLRYTPDDLNGETAMVTYRAWDQTDGRLAGQVVDASSHGGTTAYSATRDTARILVTDVNDAPVLEAFEPGIGTTDVITPRAVSVSQLTTGISDVDRSNVAFGIAIVQAGGMGRWEYSLNQTTFNPLPVVTEEAALLLFGSSVLRYLPDGQTPETATIGFRGWDTTQGLAGQLADTTLHGGATAFSIAWDTAWLSVLEVNDPPVLSGPTTPLDYIENDPPLAVFAQLQVADEDSPDFAGGGLTLSIASGGSASDRLSLLSTGEISLSGGNVLYDGGGGPQTIGTWGLQGFHLQVTFTTPQASRAAVQSVARALAFANVSENPSATDRVLQLTIVDGDGGTDSASLNRTVRVQRVNDPPQAAGQLYQVLMTDTLNVSPAQGVLANDTDPEGDRLTAILVDAPSGGTLTLRPDGSFVYQPHPLFYGWDTFTYVAHDGQADSQVTVIGIEVLLPATNPSEAGDVNGDAFVSPLDVLQVANYLAQHGEGVVPDPPLPPPFIDVNGDGLVTQADVDRAAQIVENGGSRPVPPPRLEFPSTPPVLGPGEFVQVRLQASDMAGQPLASIPAGQAFYLDVFVQDLRVAPLGVFAAYLDVTYDSQLVTVSGPLTAGSQYRRFRAGDAQVPGLIDEAGAGRTAALADGSEHLLLRVPFVAAARGTVEFGGNPADQLPSGDILLFGLEGPVPLENIVYQGTQMLVSGPPQAGPDVYTMLEDGELIIAAEQGVLVNDVDDEGDPLQALLVSGPQHGQLDLAEDGSFRYQPDPDYFGSDGFTYKASDGVFESSPATVTISIGGVDDPPRPLDDHYALTIDGSLSVPAAEGVLSNDQEVDGQSLFAVPLQPPQHGSLQLNADGSFIYTPTAGYGGPDSFTYAASDGTSQTQATVELEVLFGWRNPTHAVDVNGDGWASPLDSLLVFNDLQRSGGSRVLTNPPVPPDVAPPFLDVTGDGILSAFDAQLALQDLSRWGARMLPPPRLSLPQTPPDLGSGPLVRFRLDTTTEAGAVAQQFGLGETFYLNVYAADVRSLPAGVFSAYVDVGYNSGQLQPAGVLEYGSDFPLARSGSQQTAGLLEGVGGTRAALPGEPGERLLFRAPFRATDAGQFVFQSYAAADLPSREITLMGVDAAIPATHLSLGQAAVSIVTADADNDGVQDAEEDAGPNQGDANGDGVPDRQQAHVATLRSAVSQRYVTVVAPESVQLQDVRALSAPVSVPPSGVTFPHGFFEFRAAGLASGGEVNLVWLLESGTSANTYYRFGPTSEQPAPHLAPFLFDGQQGMLVFASRQELRVRDGGRGDGDLSLNGSIAVLGGPGLSTRPWQNPVQPLDVTNNGAVVALDVLTLINEINARGARQLPLLPEGGDTLPPFWDVTGDGWLAPNDVLVVVNYINSQPVQGEGESVAVLPGFTSPALRLGLTTAAAASPQQPAAEPIRPASDRLFAHYAAADGAQRQARGEFRTSAALSDPWDPDLELVLEEIAAAVSPGR